MPVDTQPTNLLVERTPAVTLECVGNDFAELPASRVERLHQNEKIYIVQVKIVVTKQR